MPKSNHYHENYLRRAERVQQITEQYFEPGRLDRCYAQVWRRYIYPIYPCCYRSYMNMLKIDVGEARREMTEAVSKPHNAKWCVPTLFPEYDPICADKPLR